MNEEISLNFVTLIAVIVIYALRLLLFLAEFNI